MTQLYQVGAEPHGPRYSFEVDGREFQVDSPTVTGAEIMRLAGIPPEQGLLLIEEDGTQRQMQPDEVIELAPGRRFKKRPHFRRG